MPYGKGHTAKGSDMKNGAVSGVIVVLDGTEATAELVGELSRSGIPVTAVGSHFRDVVSVITADVYALVADVTDPEQWASAQARAERRNGTVARVVDPGGLLAPRAA